MGDGASVLVLHAEGLWLDPGILGRAGNDASLKQWRSAVSHHVDDAGRDGLRVSGLIKATSYAKGILEASFDGMTGNSLLKKCWGWHARAIGACDVFVAQDPTPMEQTRESMRAS